MFSCFLSYCLLCFTAYVPLLLSKESPKYNLIIQEHAVLDKLNDASVNVFSKTGQRFSCSWDNNSRVLSENDTSHLSSSVVYSLLSIFIEFGCLTLKKSWWTYEFCFRRHVVQYHDGPKRTSETLLGVFESEYNWDNFSETLQRPKYHSQFYSNGTTCDLTNLPRRTEVQFVCADIQLFHILSVEEPETCVYLLKISTPSLCANLHFAVQFPIKPNNITCRPALSESDYYRYSALNKSRHPTPRLSAIKELKTLRPSKRLFTYKNMYNKLRSNQRRHKLNSLRRLIGTFLRSLERLSALYKKQNFKHLWSFYSGSSLHSINDDFYIWFHAFPLSIGLLNFTSILLERIVVSRCPIPLDIVKIAIIVTKSIVLEVENYIKLFNKSLTPDQAMGMMRIFNLSDIHQSIRRIWHKLFSCTDLDLAHTMLSIVVRAYKKRNFDMPIINDIPLPSLSTEPKINAKHAYLRYKLNFEFSHHGKLLQRNEKVLNNPLSYEDYSRLFDVMEKAKDYINLLLVALKLSVKKLFFLHSKIEVSHNIEKQLKQTLSNSLTNSNIKVIVLQGGDTIMKDKTHKVASSQGVSDHLPCLKQQEIIEIMQKVVTNLDPEISEELDIIEKPESQAGLSTYYIMPSGSKKKEEKRIRKLEQNYGFTFR
ncbi:hypothetical protein MN116_006150 [Schistosoma mekongi]|uniref:MRH domain-containing protein n=1 Tax=Schistosoma mekongi TaxID=38744 RepID=A0AAE1ZB26_SCHME|nr:hypothetical protein MN116_006150 [Schistosoma mekongi]